MSWIDSIHNHNQKAWVLEMKEDKSYGKRSLVDEYRREAERERQIAKQYEGCTWMGDEHPSASHLRRASLLDQAALMAERLNKK